jgi:hypothetical protein
MDANYVLSEEVAKDQFNLFLNWYDLDEDDFAEEEKAGYEQAKRKILRAIRQGRIEIDIEPDDKGDDTIIVKQTLKDDSKITYYEVSGKAKIAIREERSGPISQYTKVCQFLGGLSKLGHRTFAAMKGKDLSLAECLAHIFLKV